MAHLSEGLTGPGMAQPLHNGVARRPSADRGEVEGGEGQRLKAVPVMRLGSLAAPWQGTGW